MKTICDLVSEECEFYHWGVTYDKKGADIKDADTVATTTPGAVSDQADKDYETGRIWISQAGKERSGGCIKRKDVENPGETVLTSCDKRGFRLCGKSET